jgi:hypothetical protein
MGVMPANILPPLPRDRSSRSASELAMEDRFKRQEDLIKNLMQSQQYILSML